MRVVIALGGNAILRRGEELTAAIQLQNVKRAVTAIVRVIDAGHDVIITHGNGPQVGLMALQDAAYDSRSASPFDVLCAESQGMIGYLIVQELQNALGDERPVAALLTRIEVDPGDAAFGRPSKPIGPLYAKAEAELLATSRGWQIIADGPQFRRAVASPYPQRILEIATILQVMASGTILVCAGGGGIPVIVNPDGSYSGIEAIIDKDHTSRLLACETRSDALLMLTDVEGIFEDWGKASQRLLKHAPISHLREICFELGTMAPKVEAAITFINRGGQLAGIGRLENALEILIGAAGTRVTA